MYSVLINDMLQCLLNDELKTVKSDNNLCGYVMLIQSENAVLKLFFLLLVGVLVSACGMDSRSSVIAGYDNISGTYHYNGLGDYSADLFPNPLIDFADISVSSDVIIEQADNRFRVAHITVVGDSVTKTVDLNNGSYSNVIWRDSMLITTEKASASGPPILPLPAKHYRGTRILRGEDGNLYFIGFFKEKGFMFTDYSEIDLMLQRID